MHKLRNSVPYFKIFFISLLFSLSSVAQESHPDTSEKHEEHSEEEGAVDTPDEIDAYIKHHLKDSHDFHLFSYNASDGERKHIGFPLPVMVWTSEGFKFFMSSQFHHDDNGKVIVNAGGAQLTKLHSKIYELNPGAQAIEFDEEHHPVNASRVLDLSITKSVFGMLLIGLLIIWMFNKLARQYKTRNIPKGIGRALEPLVIYVRDDIAKPNIGEHKYKRFMSYLLSVFFFIWIGNLLGLTPLGFNITGQIAVTVCLALFTFFITQFSANADYWKHIFWMPGVPWPMKVLLIPIELLGIFTKPFALLLRLFANMTAGHTVLMSLIALMITLKADFGSAGASVLSISLTLFITLIELLVAFLQAFIFTILSALFIGMAVAEHDHAEHHGAEEDDIDEVREQFV